MQPCWTRQPDAVDPRVDRGRSTSIRACRRDRHDGRGLQTAVPNSARTPQNISGQPASLLGNRLSIGEAVLSSSSFLRRKPLGFRRYRRGAGAVERGGLENRWGCKPLLGSNPSPAVSAIGQSQSLAACCRPSPRSAPQARSPARLALPSVRVGSRWSCVDARGGRSCRRAGSARGSGGHWRRGSRIGRADLAG